ncbi:MAG: hypothetical protein QHC77_17900, partial [Stenotrophomonas sp.]|uniref:alpha/beta hydrolase family protein n=1 Tax=Stenotrophomonas sp. TaxID=69392 RepID=UPI0029BF6C8B
YAKKAELPTIELSSGGADWFELPDTATFIDKGISASSDLIDAAFNLSDYYNVDGGDTINLEPTGTGNYSTVVGLYLEDGTPFGTRLASDPLLQNVPVSYVVPQGVRKVLFYHSTRAGLKYPFRIRILPAVKSLKVDQSIIDFEGINKSVAFVTKNQSKLTYADESANVQLDFSEAEPTMNDKAIGADSSIIDSNFGLSDYVPVPEGATEVTIISKTGANTSKIVGIYDVQKQPAGNRLEDPDGPWTTTSFTHQIPEGVSFLVFYLENQSSTTPAKYPLVVSFNVGEISVLKSESGATFPLAEVKTLAESNASEIADHEARIEFLEANQDTPVYLPRPANGVVNFQVPVNCALPDVTSQTLNTQDSVEEFNDWGILQLPTNYQRAGKPTRLVIGCHGTGTWISGATTTQTAANFWLSQGYALLDMNGIPSDFVNGDNTRRHFGAPFALQSYIKGYEWAIKNYNLAKDGCFVYGISMGGLASMMLVQSGSIPVLAQGAFAPVTDHFKQAWCNPWFTDTTQRRDIALYFGFEGTAPAYTTQRPPTQAEIDYYLNNIYKVLGYNPILKHVPNVGVDVANGIYNTIPPNTIEDQPSEAANYAQYSKVHPVPLKIWHNIDDSTVKYRYSKYFVEMCKRAGCLAELRTFPSGGHNAWLNGANVTVESVDGGTVTIQSSMYECMLWFKRFE